MRRHLQQGRRQLVVGWLLALVATAVYLLTLDRSVSWWDCGEFITTSHTLQVGHPPGAPVYQLLAHLFTLLAAGNPLLIAPLSNALSAIAGGLTVMLLYWTIILLFPSRKPHWGAAVGALCYLFCDTVWFSAVESEVYSLAMLFCALTVWVALRWERRGDARRPLLVGLLLGLGTGVHLMTLLTTPMLLLVILRSRAYRRKGFARVASLAALMFLLGLSPYLIIPLRASAHPPINEGNPSTVENFAAYLKRDQYAKAPLYPRMWRQRPSDSANYAEWAGRDTGLWGNLRYYATYQLGYMYCRYLMYNYIGRENQRLTAHYNPSSHTFELHNHAHIVLFVLPFLLGLLGLACQRRRGGDLWATLLLFLFGGVVLNLYLNHPCYEPRERDYAYVLSFYAFAVWIGVGAQVMAESQRIKPWITGLLLAIAPLTLAVGNWSDHDRSRSHSVHDLAMAHLQSCDPDAVLFTVGDNDTFPLWYLLHVEQQRPDIDLYNINLTGYRRSMAIVEQALAERPVYFSEYAYRHYASLFPGRFRCEGLCWRLMPSYDGVADVAAFSQHAGRDIEWTISPSEHIDWVSASFLKLWNNNIHWLATLQQDALDDRVKQG